MLLIYCYIGRYQDFIDALIPFILQPEVYEGSQIDDLNGTINHSTIGNFVRKFRFSLKLFKFLPALNFLNIFSMTQKRLQLAAFFVSYFIGFRYIDCLFRPKPISPIKPVPISHTAAGTGTGAFTKDSLPSG